MMLAWLLLGCLCGMLAAEESSLPTCHRWMTVLDRLQLTTPSAADGCQAVVYLGSPPNRTTATVFEYGEDSDGNPVELCGWNADSACFDLRSALRMRSWLHRQSSCRANISIACIALAVSQQSNCQVVVADVFYSNDAQLSGHASEPLQMFSTNASGCSTATLLFKWTSKIQVRTHQHKHHRIMDLQSSLRISDVAFKTHTSPEGSVYLFSSGFNVTFVHCTFTLHSDTRAVFTWPDSSRSHRAEFMGCVFKSAVYVPETARTSTEPGYRISTDSVILVYYQQTTTLLIRDCVFSNFSHIQGSVATLSPFTLARAYAPYGPLPDPRIPKPLVVTNVTIQSTIFANISCTDSIFRVMHNPTPFLNSIDRFGLHVLIDHSHFSNTACENGCLSIDWSLQNIVPSWMVHTIRQSSFETNTKTDSGPQVVFKLVLLSEDLTLDTNTTITFDRCVFLDGGRPKIDTVTAMPCLYAKDDPVWIHVQGPLRTPIVLSSCVFSGRSTRASAKTDRADLLFMGNTTVQSSMRTQSAQQYVPFIADRGRIVYDGVLSGLYTLTFPRYPRRRQQVLKQVADFRAESSNSSTPRTYESLRGLQVVIDDTYSTLPESLYSDHSQSSGYGGMDAERSTLANLPRGERTCVGQQSPTYTFLPSSPLHTAIRNTSNICSMYSMHGLVNTASSKQDNASTSSYALCTKNGKYVVAFDSLGSVDQLVTTEPRWMLFKAASSQCMKVIDGSVYVLEQCKRHHLHQLCSELGCSGSQIRDEALESVAESIGKGHQQRGKPDMSLSNAVIGLPFVYTPWAYLARSLIYCSSYSTVDDVRGSIMLMPAPGEHITLHLDTLDDGLSKRSLPLKLRVSRLTATPAFGHIDFSMFGDLTLLSISGGASAVQYEAVEELSYLSNRPLTGFAVAGEPHTFGRLAVTVIAGGKSGWSDRSLTIAIPLRLRPCHLGFAMVKKKLPSGKEISVCARSSQPGVISERRGRSLDISAGFWAGNINTTFVTEDSFKDPTAMAITNTRVYKIPLGKDRRAWSTLATVFFSHRFGVAQCLHKSCRAEQWRLSSSPGESCRLGHTGPLCGKCATGLSLKIASLRCSSCVSASISLYIYITLIVVLTLLAFLIMFYFNMGMSPILDTFFFFYQVMPSATYNLTDDFGLMPSLQTFGLGHLCTVPSLTRLQATFVLLIQPAVLLVSVCLLRLVGSYRRGGALLQRQQNHMQLVRVMWFGLVYSYTMLTFTSISVLSCTTLDGKLVLAMDGSVQCYRGAHIPYAVAAALIIALIILPPPILLLVPHAKRKVFLKGFIDQASCMYRVDRQWWATVNLVRRIAIAVVLSQPRRTEDKELIMVVFLLFYFLLHITMKPLAAGNFLHISSNSMETASLFVLVLCSTLNALVVRSGPSVGTALRGIVITLAYAPTAALACALLVRQCCVKSGGFGRVRYLSLRVWWERRRGVDIHESATHNLALDNMLSDAQEPLIVAEMRNKQ
eukprot:scpid17340/ scgid0729/ 